MPKQHEITGYVMGYVLHVVFYCALTDQYIHCTKHGFFFRPTPYPEGWEELLGMLDRED